jgi:hypothetical protein
LANQYGFASDALNRIYYYLEVRLRALAGEQELDRPEGLRTLGAKAIES